MAMCWLLFGIICIQSVVSVDEKRMKLRQLEKLVANLKVSHAILSQTISEMQFENNNFKASIKDLHLKNEQLKGRLHDLEDENQTQKRINSKLKMEITEIKTLFKLSEFGELFKTKSSFMQTDELKTVLDTDGFLKDDHKSVKTIENNSSTIGIK